ncbi:MAG: BCAM0308 family protein [Actinomycetota bacterium]
MIKQCPKCGAVYDGRRWVPDPTDSLLAEMSGKTIESRMCPGDQRIENGQVEGVVTLTGGFLGTHREEVKNVVRRVAREGRHRNVAARIFEIVEEDDALVIETTDEHLAERMGKEVEKAFKGDLTIKWQAKDTFARVTWRRD